MSKQFQRLQYTGTDTCDLQGIILLDTPKQALVTPVHKGKLQKEALRRDCFSDFKPSRSRLRQRLQNVGRTTALKESSRRCIKDLSLQLISDDNFKEATDFIDEHMSDNDILRDSLQCWRTLLGQWKKVLVRDIKNTTELYQALRCDSSTEAQKILADRTIRECPCTIDGMFRPSGQRSLRK